MRVVGLTGSIACGKSTVSAWLQTQPGVRIVDGDLLAKSLTAPDGPALPLIREKFGNQVFHDDGTLHRKALARIVFSDHEARKTLDDLMSPLLLSGTESAIQHAQRDDIRVCFLDYPLLFEKGYDRFCDTVWCVTVPEDIQLHRLMARDGLSEQEALSRISSVLSSDEKAARSQVVIDNSGPVSFTLSTLPPLLEAEMSLAGSRRRRSDRYDQQNTISLSASEKEKESSVGSAEQYHPSESVNREESLFVMERPSDARKKRQKAKIAWSMPTPLLFSLIVVFFLTLASFTAQSLMNAYLTRQAEKHLREERAVFANYPLDYRGLIESTSSAFNLNPAFVSAIIRNESSFQPRAESPVGARGLMQLMPDTAEWIAGKMKVSGYAFDRMYDPESNIRFGCWYLNYLASLFQGDAICVACAYHAGQGQVLNWLSDSRYSEDGRTLILSQLSDGPTKTYAGRVVKTYGIYQELYFSETVDNSADGLHASR